MRWTTFGFYMVCLLVLAAITIAYLAHGGDPVVVVVAWFGGVFFILIAQGLSRGVGKPRRG